MKFIMPSDKQFVEDITARLNELDNRIRNLEGVESPVSSGLVFNQQYNWLGATTPLTTSAVAFSSLSTPQTFTYTPQGSLVVVFMQAHFGVSSATAEFSLSDGTTTLGDTTYGLLRSFAVANYAQTIVGSFTTTPNVNLTAEIVGKASATSNGRISANTLIVATFVEVA